MNNDAEHDELVEAVGQQANAKIHRDGGEIAGADDDSCRRGVEAVQRLDHARDEIGHGELPEAAEPDDQREHPYHRREKRAAAGGAVHGGLGDARIIRGRPVEQPEHDGAEHRHRGVAEDGEPPAEPADEHAPERRPDHRRQRRCRAEHAHRPAAQRRRRGERDGDEHADEREPVAENRQAAERERGREVPRLSQQNAARGHAEQPQAEHTLLAETPGADACRHAEQHRQQAIQSR